ncbi:hypothetical protein HYR54_02135 [Candidatus Acetothermia bacterium]|nr:hypothetical protein [Candidatus Acetothermia bacterium]
MKNVVSLSVWGFLGALVGDLIVIFLLSRLIFMFPVRFSDLQIIGAIFMIGVSMLGILYAAYRYRITGSRVGGILGGLAGYGGGQWLVLWLTNFQSGLSSMFSGNSNLFYFFFYAQIIIDFLILYIFIGFGATLGYLFATRLIKEDHRT